MTVIPGTENLFRHEIDLLITDVIMPEMNGLDLVSRVRRIRPNLKVIFTTGFNEHPVLNRGLSIDDSWMLRKPFTRELLSRTVREAIDHSSQYIQPVSIA